MEENIKSVNLSYEELIEQNNKLVEQNDFLISKIKELNVAVSFKRLDYLFQILEHDKMFTNKEIKTVSNEIYNSLISNPNEKA